MIPYEDLDRHFTAPKNWGKVSWRYKRVPRKEKKRLDKIEFEFKNLRYEQKRWMNLNPDYRRYLIKMINLQTFKL